MGYKPEQSLWEFGDLQLIEVDAKGQVSAGSDPRGRGLSIVEDHVESPAAHRASGTAAAQPARPN
jgi:hypothetical protein